MTVASANFLNKAHIVAKKVLVGSIVGMAMGIAISIAGIASLNFPAAVLAFLSFVIFMVDAIVVLVLGSRIRTRLAADAPPAAGQSERGLIFVVIAALTWGTVDAFVLGQGLVSLVLCAVGVLYLLPRAISARKDMLRYKLRLLKAGITLVAGVAAAGIVAYGNAIARERADKLVAAVEQFQAKLGRYPQQLEEIVPTFTSEIPRPNYVLIADRFRYFASPSRHSLEYYDMPPWSRRMYTFEDHRWISVE